MNNERLETKRDYKRFAKCEKRVMFHIETNAKHLKKTSWSITGICTLEAQQELYKFLNDWKKRHDWRAESNANVK